MTAENDLAVVLEQQFLTIRSVSKVALPGSFHSYIWFQVQRDYPMQVQKFRSTGLNPICPNGANNRRN